VLNWSTPPDRSDSDRRAYQSAAHPWCTTSPFAPRWRADHHHFRANSLTPFAVVIWHAKCDAQHDDAIIGAVGPQRVAASIPNRPIREVTMKRHMLTLLMLFAMGIGTQALAEDDTQAAATADTAAAVSESSAAASETSTDAAAADASAATDPMPAPADSDSK
jgi:hypothetical protein